MLVISGKLYFYLVMNEQLYIFSSLSFVAPVRPFAPRRRP